MKISYHFHILAFFIFSYLLMYQTQYQQYTRYNSAWDISQHSVSVNQETSTDNDKKTQYTNLHGVWCVSVLKDHGFLDLFVISLQLIYVRSECVHLTLYTCQFSEMFLQLTLLYPDGGHRIQVTLHPLTYNVSLLGELATETLVVLLTDHFTL